MEIKLKIGVISRDNSEYCHYAIPENRAQDREKPRKISRIRAWGDRAEGSPTPNIGYPRAGVPPQPSAARYQPRRRGVRGDLHFHTALPGMAARVGRRRRRPCTTGHDP